MYSSQIFKSTDSNWKGSTLIFSLCLLVTVGLTGCSDEMPVGKKGQSNSEVTAETVTGQPDGTPNSGTVVATADLRPINDSGVTGEVTIVDDGSTIEVTDGSAEGLDPENSFGYLSLFYDKASPPNGPAACEPGIFAHEAHGDVRRVNPHPLGSDHPLFLTEAQMLGAIWAVDSEGNGTPTDLEGEYVEVEEVGTISIRDLRINEGFGPQAVVACGVVKNKPKGPPSGN